MRGKWADVSFGGAPGRTTLSQIIQGLSERWVTQPSHMIIMLSGASVPPPSDHARVKFLHPLPFEGSANADIRPRHFGPEKQTSTSSDDNANTGHCGCRSMLRQRDDGGSNKSQAVRPGLVGPGLDEVSRFEWRLPRGNAQTATGIEGISAALEQTHPNWYCQRGCICRPSVSPYGHP